MTQEQIRIDKTKVPFNSSSAPLGSKWFINIDGETKEIIYIGKTQGNKMFGFNDDFDQNKNINNVMMIRYTSGIWRNRSNSKLINK